MPGMRGVAETPIGLRYLPDLLGATEERELLARLADLDYQEVLMRGQTARRVVRHYGVSYDYESMSVTPGEPVPGWLENVRERCSHLLGVPAPTLAEVLLTRYPPGATIGWHRDAPVFGDVVGVSLGSECVLRMQRGKGDRRRVFEQPLQQRSAYVLSGESRTSWQHSIPPVTAERFSLTFRTLRRPSDDA